MKKILLIMLVIIIAVSLYFIKNNIVTEEGKTNALNEENVAENKFVPSLDKSCAILYDTYYHEKISGVQHIEKPKIDDKYKRSEKCLKKGESVYLIKEGDYSGKNIGISEFEGSYFEIISETDVVTLEFSDGTKTILNSSNPTLKIDEKSIKNLVAIDNDVLFLSNTLKIEEMENEDTFEMIE